MKRLSDLSLFTRVFQVAAIFISFKVFNSAELNYYSNEWARILGIYYLLPLLYFGFNTTYFNYVRINNIDIKKGLDFGISIMLFIILPSSILVIILLNIIYPDLHPTIILVMGFYLFFNFINTLTYTLNKERNSIIIQLLTWVTLSIFFTVIYLFKSTYFTFIRIGVIFFAIQIGFSIYSLKYLPKPKYLRIDLVKSQFAKSIEFFIASISSNFLNSGQVLIVEQLGITTNLSNYLIIQKIFSLISNLHLSYIAPLNIQLSNLLQERNFKAIRNTINRINYTYSLPALVIVFVISFYLINPLFQLITGSQQNSVESKLSILFAAYYLIISLSNIYSVVINTDGQFRFQIFVSLISTFCIIISLLIFKNLLSDLLFPISALIAAIITFAIYYLNFSMKYT